MQARITADELARDVAGAELLVSRHKENKVEIDKKVKEKGKFEMRGRALISEKNFLAAQVNFYKVVYKLQYDSCMILIIKLLMIINITD